MKIKRIKNEKELKAGAYIRAVINRRGMFWIEYVLLTGRAFTYRCEFMRPMRKYPTANAGYTDSHYFGTLSTALYTGVSEEYRTSKFGTVLIPFSNKVFNYLSSIKGLRTFAEVISGKCISDNEYDIALSEYKYTQHMDQEIDRQRQY